MDFTIAKRKKHKIVCEQVRSRYFVTQKYTYITAPEAITKRFKQVWITDSYVYPMSISWLKYSRLTQVEKMSNGQLYFQQWMGKTRYIRLASIPNIPFNFFRAHIWQWLKYFHNLRALLNVNVSEFCMFMN